MAKYQAPQFERFAILEPIDRSRNVWKGYDLDERVQLAIKGPNAANDAQTLLDEAAHIQAVHAAHAARVGDPLARAPGIIDTPQIEYFRDDPYLVFPFIEKRPRVFYARSTTAEGLDMVAYMLDTIALVHKGNRAHNDAKLENWLETTEDRPSATVFDFGRALVRRTPSPYQILGTIGYASPQAMCGEHDPRGDVFTMGVNAFVLFTGREPFPVAEKASEPEQVAYLMNAIARGRPQMRFLPQYQNVPKPVRETMTAMLEMEPENRPSLLEARNNFAAAQSQLQ